MEKQCCAYDAESPSGHCQKKWFALGRCKQHWQALRTFSPSERKRAIASTGMPVRNHFEWLGDEEFLAAQYGGNEDV